jgi:hypothetical protein
LPDEQTRALRALWLRREQLIVMLVMEQNRLEHAAKMPRHRLRAHIDYLRKEISTPKTTWTVRCATRRGGTGTKC